MSVEMRKWIDILEDIENNSEEESHVDKSFLEGITRIVYSFPALLKEKIIRALSGEEPYRVDMAMELIYKAYNYRIEKISISDFIEKWKNNDVQNKVFLNIHEGSDEED